MADKRSHRLATEPTDTVEQHPIRHKWYVIADFVTDRAARGRIRQVTREERCEFCPTVLLTKINTITWTKEGHPRYKYAKGVTISRVSKPEYTKAQFLATTKLSPDDIAKLG